MLGRKLVVQATRERIFEPAFPLPVLGPELGAAKQLHGAEDYVLDVFCIPPLEMTLLREEERH